MRTTANPRRLAIGVLLAFLYLTSPANAGPFSIEYLSSDLPDVAGEDLWRYSYVVSGPGFSANQGFTIYFEPALYRAVQHAPPPPHADWEALTIDPDAALDSAGWYDALALSDNASLADPFEVEFVWLGSTRPGSQPFDIYDFNLESDELKTLDSGVTTPAAVPEQGTTLLMMAIGILALARGFRRRSLSR